MVTAYPPQPADDANEALDVRGDLDSPDAIAKRYRLLVELSPDAICVHKAGIIVYINPAGVRLARVGSADDMIGRWITEFVHPDSIPDMLERLSSLGAEETATEPAEALMLLADGTTKPAEIVSVRTEWDGEPAFQVIMRDISTQKAAEEALRYQAALVDHMGDAVIALSADRVVQSWNPAAERMYGRPATTAIGSPLEEAVGARLDPAQIVAGGGTREEVHHHKDGSRRIVRVSVTSFGVGGFVVLCADLTATRQAVETLARVIVELSEAVIVVDTAGSIEIINPAAVPLLGIDPATVPGARLADLPLSMSGEDLEELLYAVHGSGTGFRGKLATRIDRTGVWLQVSCTPMDSDLDGLRAVISFTDVTGQVNDTELERYRAMHDGLTGLLNYAGLLEKLEEMLVLHRGHRPVSIHYFDLDRFKFVNDSMGHTFGNEVLRDVARRLESAAGADAVVGRLGGDEFSVVWPLDSGDTAQAQTDALLAAVTEKPLMWHTSTVRMTASIGVVVVSTYDDRSAADLLRDADIALFSAKQSGRARAVQFEDSMGVDFLKRRRREQELRTAIATENRIQLVNNYQWIFEYGVLHPLGIEARPMWQRSSGEVVESDALYQLAEQADLSSALAKHTLQLALVELIEVIGYEPGAFRLCVHVPLRQLQEEQLAADIAQTVTSAGVQLSDLCVQITEDVFTADHQVGVVSGLEQVQRLRSVGVEVAIDNYGQGNSSLHRVQQAPVNRIKLARSLISDMTQSRFAESLVRSVVDIARAGNVEVVASGIDSESSFAGAITAGCRYVQGTWLHGPESAELAAQRISR